jgi:hypothetical protein
LLPELEKLVFLYFGDPMRSIKSKANKNPLLHICDLYDPLTMPAEVTRAHVELDRSGDRSRAVSSVVCLIMMPHLRLLICTLVDQCSLGHDRSLCNATSFFTL